MFFNNSIELPVNGWALTNSIPKITKITAVFIIIVELDWI